MAAAAAAFGNVSYAYGIKKISREYSVKGLHLESNDVYDYDTGADKNKKESVVNLFGGHQCYCLVAACVGVLGLSLVAVKAGNPRSMMFCAAAIFGFYIYQCPPFRLSYHGVGEPLLFFAFGPFSTIGSYLLHSVTRELPLSSTVIWASVLVGLTTSLILFCSHFHQVRLGTGKGSLVVKWYIIGLYSLILVLGFTQTLPFASVLLSALTLPMGNLVVSFVQKNHMDKRKIFMSKYFCVRLHTLLGLAFSAGLVVARMFTKQPLPQAIGL
ncbi:UNVERIFIED_CONTAM: 2-carboxy-1,4-naphthoquinone phytyltransferase, chloroplastic [Sesamum latifolium]|uniref:2-carboxy-1,4-naphthoquinone phytyltransferase, chloroplastic n=1 Tax=Sesamum latifolium TaxID=2727402 RepID=A0AAW2UZ53_9LAMI